MAKVLITGINGLIGGVISGPLQKGFDVRGLDITGPYSDHVFEADVSDYDQVASVFEKLAPIQFVVHLAGRATLDAPWGAILSANIVGTRNIYEAAKAFKVQRVVFASSNHVTGAFEGFEANLHLHLEHEPERITVQHPIRPDSDYGVSKAFGEAVARYYCARWGIESICLRIGSVRPVDDPSTDPRLARTWLSHRDLISLIERSLAASIKFGIYYGISNNRGAFWDISNARSELGYSPIDDAARFGSP